jgi:hypothetical protein
VIGGGAFLSSEDSATHVALPVCGLGLIAAALSRGTKPFSVFVGKDGMHSVNQEIQ